MKISDPKRAICELLFKWKQKINHQDQMNSLSLYLVIQDYREFITPECFLDRFPECENEKAYVALLYAHFRKQTQQELAELAIAMIHELTEGVIQ